MTEFRQKRDLGQNFLKDLKYINLVVNSLQINPEDIVLEIGAGSGSITDRLVNWNPRPKKVITYEIDDELLPTLKEKFKWSYNLQVLNENFLDAVHQNWGRANKAVGAIPYYITSPIIHKLLKKQKHLETIVLIIQKEVADKIVVRHKASQNYWSYLPFFYDTKVVANIKRHYFNPAPKVDSSIILFTLNKEKEELFRKKRIKLQEWEDFLHRLFSHPRKMISYNYDSDELKSIGIDPRYRAHQLKENQVVELFLHQRKSGIL